MGAGGSGYSKFPFSDAVLRRTRRSRIDLCQPNLTGFSASALLLSPKISEVLNAAALPLGRPLHAELLQPPEN